MQVNRDQIIQEALSWKGVRFRHQGRTRIHGVDCAGLIIAVAQELGLSKFDVANYRREPNQEQFIQHFRDQMREKPVVDREPGDIVLLRDNIFTCHTAILDHNNYMIHAFAARRKVVREQITDEWTGRMTYCFAFPGVDD